jgi:hypothetical protein
MIIDYLGLLQNRGEVRLTWARPWPMMSVGVPGEREGQGCARGARANHKPSMKIFREKKKKRKIEFNNGG